MTGTVDDGVGDGVGGGAADESADAVEPSSTDAEPRRPSPSRPAKTAAKTAAAKKAAAAKQTPADAIAKKAPAKAAQKVAGKVVAKAAADAPAVASRAARTTKSPAKAAAIGPSLPQVEQVPDDPAAAVGPADGRTRPTAWRLLMDAGRPRATRAQVVVALLCGLLGFGLVTQVHSTAGSGLTTARQSDLVDILDSLSARSEQLRSQIATEQSALSKLTGGTDRTQAALDEAQQRAATLQILAGTVAAVGPGIELQISDPQHRVTAEVLLGVLEELRDAGAEAIQINDVRVVAGTYFTQASSGVQVDGHGVSQPYRFKVIGNPPDLEPALNIPGGVVQTLEKEQATADVVRSQKIIVNALRLSKQPDYARSSSG
ncbi:MAG: hypothetical protein QOH29_808 [Actinomycetota bacterium]|nr:hypothetical protein [Actinomycetota bacterium]